MPIIYPAIAVYKNNFAVLRNVGLLCSVDPGTLLCNLATNYAMLTL